MKALKMLWVEGMSRNEHKASNGDKTCLVHKTDMALVCVLPLEFIKKIAEEPKTEIQNITFVVSCQNICAGSFMTDSFALVAKTLHMSLHQMRKKFCICIVLSN